MAAPKIELLRARADLVTRTREFFAARGVLEVDTGVLGRGVVVEAHIDPVPCRVRAGERADRYLLTSPEGPMKRLLVAGSGPIFQLAHAFRAGEVGRRHAEEFTLLEWYRPGFDHHALMDEVEALVAALLPDVATPFARRSYREVFRDGAGIDPFTTSLVEVRAVCESFGVPLPAEFDRSTLDDALDLLLVSHLEPTLGAPAPLFVLDYPESQAALARVREGDDGLGVADRFELYVRGVELANGYHELADAVEQRARFERANQQRAAAGRTELPLDEELLDALANGLPPCAGVALGFDRLVMLATGADDIADVRA